MMQVAEDSRLLELEKSEARRHALETAARKIEEYPTNELYHKALKMGAALIRAMKDEK